MRAMGDTTPGASAPEVHVIPSNATAPAPRR
jgi:hypothetical protein